MSFPGADRDTRKPARKIVYERTFGLRERPFGVTPDPRAFYVNRLYAEAEANLLYGIRERRGFVVLTGEVGTGKTTVLRRVMDQLTGEIPFVLVFHTNLSFDEILTFVCHELAVEPAAPTRLARIEALNSFLLGQTRLGKTTALLIDEAQDLSDETLEAVRLLSNLETSGEKLLQIVLVGQPELEARLDSPELRQLRQRVAVRCRLERLEATEVGAYVRRRLECAGAARDLFASDAIARIAVYSKGIPRVINVICDNALLIAYAASQHVVRGDIITEVAEDLRLREARPVAVDEDLLGLESALHRVEREAARPEPRPAAKGPDLLWVALLLGLFAGAAALVAQWFRDDSGPRAWIPSTQADARLLTEPVAAEPGLAPAALAAAPDEAPVLPEPGLVAAEPGLTLAVFAAAPDQAPVVPEPGPQPARPAGTWPGDEDSPLPEKAPGRDASRGPVVYSVPAGSTAYQIAAAAYGSWCQLGLDLMAEANPGIDDLDRIVPGQRLELPPIGGESLVRRDADGTERIVLASYMNASTASRFAVRAERLSGFEVEVRATRLSGNVRSHRVEVVGLRGTETGHAWRRAALLGLLPPRVAAFGDGSENEGRRARAATCIDAGVIRRN